MSRPIVNILFLGGAKRVAIARLLKDAGHRRGVDVGIFGYELDDRVPLAAIGEIITGRRWSDPELQQSLEQVVERYKIDIILPFVDGAIAPTALFAVSHPDVYCPVSNPEISALFFDKVLSAQAFESAGISIPTTVNGCPDTYPVIAKPRFGSASKGIIVIDNATEFDSAAIDPEKYLVQKYIADRTEITADCFVGADGEILAVSPRIRLETAGGEAVRTITIDDSEVITLAERTLRALHLRGAVTIQFIRDNSTGQLMVMEINPRLGGGVVASIHAGADIASLILNSRFGLSLTRLHATPGVLTTRYLQEVVFYPAEK